MRRLCVLMLAALAFQCSSDTEKTLYKNTNPVDPIKYIKYSGSERREYFMEAEMINEGLEYYYNIRFLQGGKIMHVLKYESRFMEKDGYDSKQHFLVTDTSSKWGPNYFGEGINGYYDSYVVNNFLSQPHPPRINSKVTDREWKLFRLIDSLTTEKKVNFDKVDSMSVIGWLKYDY